MDLPSASVNKRNFFNSALETINVKRDYVGVQLNSLIMYNQVASGDNLLLYQEETDKMARIGRIDKSVYGLILY